MDKEKLKIDMLNFADELCPAYAQTEFTTGQIVERINKIVDDNKGVDFEAVVRRIAAINDARYDLDNEEIVNDVFIWVDQAIREADKP